MRQKGLRCRHRSGLSPACLLPPQKSFASPRPAPWPPPTTALWHQPPARHQGVVPRPRTPGTARQRWPPTRPTRPPRPPAPTRPAWPARSPALCGCCCARGSAPAPHSRPAPTHRRPRGHGSGSRPARWPVCRLPARYSARAAPAPRVRPAARSRQCWQTSCGKCAPAPAALTPATAGAGRASGPDPPAWQSRPGRAGPAPHAVARHQRG